eukprot:EG_transcript_8628
MTIPNSAETVRRPDLSQAEIVRLTRITICAASNAGRAAAIHLIRLARRKEWAGGRPGKRFHTEVEDLYLALLRSVEFWAPQDLYKVVKSLVTLQSRNSAFHAFLQGEGRPLVEVLANRTSSGFILNFYDGRQVARLLLALAELQAPIQTLQVVGEWMVAMASRAPPAARDLVTALFGLALGHCKAPHVSDALTGILTEAESLQQLSPQAIGTVAWAVATLRANRTVMERLLDHAAQKQMPEVCGPKDLSRLLWAAATANVRHEPFLSKVAAVLPHSWVPGACRAWDVLDILWAYAALGFRADNLLVALGDQLAGGLLHQLRPDNLVAVGWAFATLNVRHAAVLTLLAQELGKPEVLWSLSTSELVEVLWVFGTLKHPSPELFEGLAHHLVSSGALAKALRDKIWADLLTLWVWIKP